VRDHLLQVGVVDMHQLLDRNSFAAETPEVDPVLSAELFLPLLEAKPDLQPV
jgi:hypothetical protein